MNKNNKTLIYCITAVCVILMLFAAACLFIAVKDEYQSAMGYFKVSSVFAPVSFVLMLSAPVIGIIGWIGHMKKAAPDKMMPQSLTIKILLSALAASTLLSVVMNIMSKNTPINANSAFAVLKNASYVLGVLSAVSLCMTAFATGRRLKATASLFAFFPPLYFASLILCDYFDQTVAVNSPIKVITQLSLVCLVLLFTAEAGLSLGRGNIFPRYIFALCISVIVPGTLGITGILMRLFTENTFSVRVSDSAVLLIGAVYAAVRLFLTSKVELCPKAEKEKKKKTVEEEPADAYDGNGDSEI